MHEFKKILLSGCAYTVIILTFIYIFAAIAELASAGIAFLTFALIALFGFLLSLADTLCDIFKLKSILKCIIRYVVIVISILIVYSTFSKGAQTRASTVFAVLFVFTILYVGFSFLAVLISRSFEKATDRKSVSTKKKDYKSIYGGK